MKYDYDKFGNVAKNVKIIVATYFGEKLNGLAFSQNCWVQSYGSRCVKPPHIYGDVSRPEAMTVDWITYAQSLTKREMKGMLMLSQLRLAEVEMSF